MDSNNNNRRNQVPITPNASSYQDQRNFQHDEPLNNTNNPDLYEYDNQNNNVREFVNTGADQPQDQYKRDLLDMMCGQINQSLLIPKSFYFFFFAAFGSLFPLMAIYFKQMAMSPIQVGILFGLKPFIEFLATPFWAHIGQRWRQAKFILLFSLICWIGFTLGLGFIHPPVHSCLMHNETHLFLSKTADNKLELHARNKRDIVKNSDPNLFIDGQQKQWRVINVTRIIRIRKTTKRPTTTAQLHHIVNYRPPGSDTSKHRWVGDRDMAESEDKESNYSFDKAADGAINEILNEKNNKNPKKIVDKAIGKSLNELNLKKNTRPTSTKQNNKFLPDLIPILGKISVPISLDLATQKPNPKEIEVKNYFDKGDLESAKKKGKVVFLDAPDMNLIKPDLETSVVYHRDDVQHVFIVFLFFILAGEFFSAPAITLADQSTMSTLATLGPNAAETLYGRQRMFGSLGWAISMFSVGIILDNARIFTNHPCGTAGPGERNYSVCFAIYAVLMGFAFIVATQFKFEYGDEEGIPLKSVANNLKNKVNNPQFNPQIFVNDDGEDGVCGDMSNSNQQQNQQNYNQPEVINENRSDRYMELFQVCKSSKHLTFLFIVWFMGIGVGLVFTFLFWHLQDMGGTPTLYGVASVINHLSELAAYFFVNQLVRKYGHIKIFLAGLLGNTLRFTYVAVLTEPIWILPFEFIQGITHALVWATSTSYFAQSIPEELRATAQSVLQGLHFGLGRGFGALLGGFFIAAFGSKITFFLYGLSCFIIMIVFIYINKRTTDQIKRQNNPHFTENQYVNQNDDLNKPIPEFQNVSNPTYMNDTNVYYRSDAGQQDPNKTSFPVMSPHGVPSSNPQNWNNNRNYL